MQIRKWEEKEDRQLRQGEIWHTDFSGVCNDFKQLDSTAFHTWIVFLTEEKSWKTPLRGHREFSTPRIVRTWWCDGWIYRLSHSRQCKQLSKLKIIIHQCKTNLGIKIASFRGISPSPTLLEFFKYTPETQPYIYEEIQPLEKCLKWNDGLGKMGKKWKRKYISISHTVQVWECP